MDLDLENLVGFAYENIDLDGVIVCGDIHFDLGTCSTRSIGCKYPDLFI